MEYVLWLWIAGIVAAGIHVFLDLRLGRKIRAFIWGFIGLYIAYILAHTMAIGPL